MGKSNKFDYTNRPNSGAKLGHIIGRDLEKEVDKAIKDAHKQATKTRKVSTGSATSSAASVDTRDTIIHTLDIKVPGKQLGDEGACAMAAGLETALRKGTEEASVALEDLDLSSNGITTLSLERLAPAIALASADMMSLNLANNAIKVETDDEAAQWETFLCAFNDCISLRRIDFVNNTSLGARAMEILARVHIMEEPIKPKTPGTSVRCLIKEFLDDDQPTPKASEFNKANIRGRRHGLRSLPFLVLNNTGLSDAGALWLSYVVEDHHYPSQLAAEINVTDAEAIDAAQQGGHYRGIQWEDGEHHVGKDGLHLLKKAEAIRQQSMFSGVATVTSSEIVGENGADGDNDENDMPGRRSFDRKHSRAKRGDRRISIRSTHSLDDGHSELESIRKKVQRAIIDKHGVSSVELWRTGLRMAIASHTLQGIGPTTRNQYIGPHLFDFNKRRDSTRPITPSPDTKNKRTPSDKTRPRQGTYAATLTANTNATAGEPELAITEVTNSPTTPKMIFKPHRKGAFSDGGDAVLAQKLDALVVRNQNPQRFMRSQEMRMLHAQFRDRSVPNHLPADVIARISGFVVSDRERKLLSEKQVENVAAWGRDRKKVVEMEHEWRKHADSAQVWMLLENINCLEYQRE